MFDKNNSKNAHIIKYFNGKKALIVDPVGCNRTAIKKTLLNFGFMNSDIGNVDTFELASDYIMENHPDIVFVKSMLDKNSGLELLKKHEIVCPNRLLASFFLITEDNDPATACIVLETETDGIFVTPFTVEGLENTILKSLQKKIKPSPYSRTVEEGKEHLILEEYDQAIAKFEEACDLNKTPVLANYYKSVICLHRSNNSEALKLLEENVEQNPKHYKSLTKITECYTINKQFEDAYISASTLLENYPLHPERIPEMTRLSIQNRKYEDIKNYAKIFSSLKNVSEQLQTYVAAGLAICGRFLCLQEKNPNGEKVLLRAAKICEGKINVLRNLSETFMKLNKKNDAIALLAEYKTDKTDDMELNVLIFELEASGLDISQKIVKGRELLSKGFKHPRIYELLIKELAESGFKADLKEDLYFEACNEFPDAKLIFDQVYDSTKVAS
jgi:tetratricopeptide (TPR) repeat protein